jgi:predicted permease
MSLLLVIVNALVPIIFVIALGYLAGRIGLIEAASSGILAILAIDFCLPSLLFNATANMPTSEFQNWRFFLGIALGLMVNYLLALTIALTIFKEPIAESSLQALCSSFPNMAFMGIPLMIAVFGTSAVLSVVIGNLISSFILLPITLAFLETDRSTQLGRQGGAMIWSVILDTLKKPLIWAPFVGIMMALTHVPMPLVWGKSFELIGSATSGVALFAMGLVLSGQKLRLRASVATSVVLKNVAQPATMWLLAILLGITGVYRREMILLGALPTASMTTMFAVRYDIYTDESTATVLLSTLLSIATLCFAIALTR